MKSMLDEIIHWFQQPPKKREWDNGLPKTFKEEKK